MHGQLPKLLLWELKEPEIIFKTKLIKQKILAKLKKETEYAAVC
jgi:hypothetical protein